MKTCHTWRRNTTVVVGDSMLSGIEDRRISNGNREVKVKYFLEETIDDVYDYMKRINFSDEF